MKYTIGAGRVKNWNQGCFPVVEGKQFIHLKNIYFEK